MLKIKLPFKLHKRNKKKNQQHHAESLRSKIWLYFMIFTVIVVIVLWLFQIVFLGTIYKSLKARDVEKISDKILYTINDNDYYSKLKSIALDNDLCIKIVTKYGQAAYDADTMSGNCVLHSFDSPIKSYMQMVDESDNGEIRIQMINQKTQAEMLLYGTVIRNSDGDVQGYLFINTPLAPVESTVSILKRQLALISVILILTGFVISFFLSRKIARPIARITKCAKNLGRGNYDVKFVGGGYYEADELARTLTYASKEISRVDMLQRDLIANVSHDLRTPLTMLKAYAEMIRDLSGNNPIKREEHLGIIIDETDRLALLVTDMLDLSKIESGGLELNYSVIDVKSKLQDIMDRYKGISEQMGYHIHFEPDEECFVSCDISKIERVICNLINNAINYTGEDKNIYIKQINMDDGVKIEIKDTGRGISKADIELIFDKYYRSENHKREVVGTGLGLSIVKAVLKKHNFAYGVSSVVGQGSTFWFKMKYTSDNTENQLVKVK